MRSVLVIVSALIAYGSLYPFDFQLHPHDVAALTTAPFNPLGTHRGDLLGNLVLFLPFGFAGIFAMRPFGGRVVQLIVVILSGGLLALLLQIGQVFVPQRDPSLVDVFWNVIGVILGAMIAVTPVAGRLLLSMGESIALEVPVMLAGIWVASELMPLVPSVDLQLVKENLKALILVPQLQIQVALVDFAAWLAALHFLWCSKLPKTWRILLPLLPFAVLTAEPFIIRHQLGLSQVVGTVGGAVVWIVARQHLRPALLAGLLFVGILAAGLYPLDVTQTHNAFSWVPFGDFLNGSMVVNATVLVRKLFLYGALVWLLQEAGMNWTASTALTVAALTVQEALQVYMPGASAEVTDPLLAVLVAMAMRSVGEPAKPSAPEAKPVMSSRGWAEVPIGLTSDQVSFLKRFSTDGGRSISGATRLVIADFIKRLSREEADAKPARGDLSVLGSMGVRPEDGPARKRRGREHEYVVNLPDDYVEFLNALSAKLGTSIQRTVQLIVDDFITERTERERGP
jgi:VanZ family protein